MYYYCGDLSGHARTCLPRAELPLSSRSKTYFDRNDIYFPYRMIHVFASRLHGRSDYWSESRNACFKALADQTTGTGRRLAREICKICGVM
jgi:hypothetical protein